MDKKIFDNDTLTSQEKLDEIYVMVKDLHGGAIEKDDLMKAIDDYISVVFDKLIADGNCDKVDDSPPDSPLFGSGSGGGTPPPLELSPAAKRKTRQSGGSRNRRITPIGKKIGGISLKKRTPKSKKKSRSKK